MKNCLLLLAATVLGGVCGVLTVLCIIAAFAEMILTSVFNIYYASIFFMVGSYYTYKIIKKN